MSTKKARRGFTMIELMVAVAIIGLISSIVLSSVSTARAKARDATRLQHLRELRTALETYRLDRGSYPATGSVDDPMFRGSCSGWGSDQGDTSGADGWIPNLAPQYISVLPLDPKPGPAPFIECYLYISDGRDYMILAYQTVETYTEESNPAPRPAYSSGVNYEDDFAVFTDGARDW